MKVEALAGGIGGANKPNVAVLDGRLDLLASGGTALVTLLNEGGGASGINCNRFGWEGLTERFGNPFRCREILAKNDSAVFLEPFVALRRSAVSP